MAFIHGKNSRLWIDGYELSKYFNEYNAMEKAGVAETTVFGVGAKTYIGGLREGQLSGKGFFGANPSTDTQDSELVSALGRSNNMAITLAPTGLLGTSAGTRCIVAYAAETDYSITSPVSGVVSTSMTAQADSGLKSGVILYDPTAAAITTTGTVLGTGVLDMGSTDTSFTATAGQTLPITSLTVTSIPVGTPTYGTIAVETSSGQATYSYTGWSTATFTGLTQITSVTGGATVNTTAGGVTLPALTYNGLVANLHLLSFYDTGGVGGSSATFNIQESDDSTTWTTLATFGGSTGTNIFGTGLFGSGNFGTPGTGGAIVSGSAASPTLGGYSLLVAAGTPIARYLRAQVVTTMGAGASLTFGISAARQ